MSVSGLRNMSWFFLLRVIWRAKRNNRKSAHLYAMGRISADTRVAQIEFFENLMFRIFKEMYRRLFDRPYQVRVKNKHVGH